MLDSRVARTRFVVAVCLGTFIPVLFATGCGMGAPVDTNPMPAEKRAKYLEVHPEKVVRDSPKKGKRPVRGLKK